jgi:uncharacterized protein (DUF58 family)
LIGERGLDPDLLAQIETLHLTAKNSAHGALAGMHRSTRRGSAMEFSEHKVYAPGDDIRHIDWNVFAKTDRYHVKQFEDETNLRLELLIDHSGSMGFAGNALSKLDFARDAAAALAYLALRQGDAVGLSTFTGILTGELPARATSSHLMEVLRALAALVPGDETSIVASVDTFATRRRPRSVTILFTDLFDPSGDIHSALARLAARRHDLSVMHVLDEHELEFPYELPAT